MLAGLTRSPLAFRIYLVGVAQTIVVLLGFVVLRHLNRPPPPNELHAEERALARAVEDRLENPAEIKALIEAARESNGLEATVVSPHGDVVASTVPIHAARCMPGRPPPPPPGNEARPPSRDDKPPPPRGDPPPPDHQSGCYTVALNFPSGARGHIELRPTNPKPLSPFNPMVIGFVLLVVAVSSWLLARSLVCPLSKLSTAARVFGEGDLSARAHLGRSDELGEVARAFDDMADRVADLVNAEKELVANVSHELRTPLARIRVALDIASEGDAAVIQESLTDITDDLGELERLVTDVVTAARLDLATDTPRGIPPLRKERLSLEHLLAQAATRFQTAHPDRRLELDVPSALGEVDGDPVLLRRAIDNLLENAHKYTEVVSYPVELSARRRGSECLIEVRDQGVGIAADDLSQVFQPFFRVDRGLTRATSGLGLGLALVSRIVKAHGGTVSVDSEVGEGTTVAVRVPIIE